MKAEWEFKPLGDVCKTGSGGTPLKSQKDFYENGTIPWLMSGEVSQGEVHKATKFITQKGLENSSARIFPINTVLIAMYGATAGQVGILKFEASTNQAVCGVMPNEQFIPKFLYYFFLSKQEELVLQATGNAQPNISQIKIKNTLVPIIDKSEQQRIVAILDQALEGIAKTRANAEQNLHNARDLFESYKAQLFDNSGQGYELVTLKELCEKITQGPNPKYDKNGVDNFRVLKTKNLYDNHIFYEEADKVSANVFNTCLSSELQDGDLLLAIVGQGSINKCNVFKNQTSFRFIYTRALGLIRTNKLKLNPYYLLAFLQSKDGKELIDEGIGGTSGQQVVTTTYIKMLRIPLPPIKTQQAIVDKLNSISNEIKKLEAFYERKIACLDELKKSLLQQAFAGEL